MRSRSGRATTAPGRSIQSAARPAGGAWSLPVNLSNADWNATEPQVAMSSAGEAIALWSRYNGTHYIVQSAIRLDQRRLEPGR